MNYKLSRIGAAAAVWATSSCSLSEVEIRSDIVDLLAEKAPGPNGFTIKHEIMAAFHCIYNQTIGPLPKLNGVLLTLLTKTEIAERPGDFSRLTSSTHLQNWSERRLLCGWLHTSMTWSQTCRGPSLDAGASMTITCMLGTLRKHTKKTPALLMKFDI
jgi:hypothetical protein